MEITLTLKAPELSEAIRALAIALSNKSTNVTVSPSYTADTSAAPAPLNQAQYVSSAPVVTQMQQPVQYSNPVQAPIQQAPITPAVVPTTEQTYTIDQLAVAATQLMDAGRQNEIVSLLSAFGVQALMALPKEQYGAFATQLRAMGAKI